MLKIEVHADLTMEPWLTIDWLRTHLLRDPIEIAKPEFSPSTDVFLFYEKAVVNPSLYSQVPVEKRFGLLLEPSILRPFAFMSLGHVDKFRMILTHDPLLLSVHPNYHKNLFGSSWVFRDEDVVSPPEKTKIISMITSNLSSLTGHRLRLSICRKLYERKSQVDIWGRNIPWGPFIADRRDGVAPYLFNIAIENCQRDNYFTEKLIDCFVTRTCPIYWGCPNIAEFFNAEGIIIIKSEDEFWDLFDRIMSDPFGIYEERRGAVEENFRLAVEKYNTSRAWGSVADRVIDEAKAEFVLTETSYVQRMKLWAVQQAMLARYHRARALKGTARAMLRRAMNRA